MVLVFSLLLSRQYEKQRERDRETETGTERQRETETDRQTDRQNERQKKKKMEAYQRQKKKKEETNTPKNPLTEEKAMNQSMYFISHTVWSEPNGKQKWVQKNTGLLSLFIWDRDTLRKDSSWRHRNIFSVEGSFAFLKETHTFHQLKCVTM